MWLGRLMARSYAQLHQRIWADPEWRSLDVDSQHLYLLLISQPQMNMAGVLPLQLRKWASCVSGWDIATVDEALDRLRADRFVVVDEDTEEVLVRTLIRNDGGYKTPGMLRSILGFAEGVQSIPLRAVLAVELGKLEPLEGKTSEDGRARIAATRLALSFGTGPSAPGGEPIPDGIGDGMSDGIGDTFLGTHPGYHPNSSAEPIPDTIADTSVTVTGSVAGLSLVRNMGGEHFPHPPRCARHDALPIGDEPPCRPCQRLRESWEVANEEALKVARAEASRPKPMCPRHPGQIAAFCGPCRSEQISKETA